MKTLLALAALLTVGTINLAVAQDANRNHAIAYAAGKYRYLELICGVTDMAVVGLDDTNYNGSIAILIDATPIYAKEFRRGFNEEGRLLDGIEHGAPGVEPRSHEAACEAVIAGEAVIRDAYPIEAASDWMAR